MKVCRHGCDITQILIGYVLSDAGLDTNGSQLATAQESGVLDENKNENYFLRIRQEERIANNNRNSERILWNLREETNADYSFPTPRHERLITSEIMRNVSAAVSICV